MIKKKRFSIFLITFFLILFFEFSSYLFLKFFTNNGTFRQEVPRFLFDPIIGRKMQPNYFDSNKKPRTNTYGRAITPIQHNVPQLTVIITGASAVFQSSSRNNSMSIPSIIEEKINNVYGIKAEVINLALPGFTSYQELMELHDYFLSEKANIVISISGYSDITARFEVSKITDPEIYKGNPNKRYDLIFDTRYFNKLGIIEDLEKGKFIFHNFDYFLRKNSYFIELIDRIIQKLNSIQIHKNNKKNEVSLYHSYLKENLTKEILKMQEDQIKHKAKISISHYAMMDTLSEINDADFFLFLQPTALSWDHFEKTDSYQNFREYEKTLLPIYKENFNNFYDELNTINKSIGNLYDFRKVLDSNKGEIFKDHIHYNDLGTAIISDEILNILSSKFLWKKKKN